MAKGVSREAVHSLVVRRWRHAREYDRPWNDLFGKLLAFSIDQEHYRRNFSLSNNDVRRLQPRSQRLTNIIRHKVSSLSTQPIRFKSKPVQFDSDAYGAHLSQKLIENTVFDPCLRYKQKRRKFLLSAFGGGRGAIAIEYNPTVPGGVVLRIVDPRRLHAAPGTLDFHDQTCPYWIEEVKMHLSEVRRKKDDAGWDVPDDLKPDNWKSDYTDGHQLDTGNLPFDQMSNDNIPGADEGEQDGIVTILRVHWKYDPFSETSVPKYDLPREDWHWHDQPTGQKYPLGDTEPGSGPTPIGPSGGPMNLVTTRDSSSEHYRYPEGRQDIVAPFYRGQKSLWSGNWLPGAVDPKVRLTHVPYMFMLGYHHPLRLIGASDTQYLKTLTQIDNMSFRSTWEQLRMAQALVIATRGGLEGAQPGVPFEFSDKPIELVFAKDRLAAESVKFFQANGMNPAMPAFRQMLASEWQWIGTGDVSMPDDRSRDIAVGTFTAMQRMGDLPLKMHQDDLADEEAVGFRVMLDLKRAYMTMPEMITWVDENTGQNMAEQATSDMLEPVNVSIQTTPDWSGMDADMIQAVAQFMGQITNPKMRAVLAPTVGFPPEVVQELRAEAAQTGPVEAPDKLMLGLAALYKSGVPVSLPDVNAVMQQAGLPPLQGLMPPQGAAQPPPGPPNGGPQGAGQ